MLVEVRKYGFVIGTPEYAAAEAELDKSREDEDARYFLEHADEFRKVRTFESPEPGIYNGVNLQPYIGPIHVNHPDTDANSYGSADNLEQVKAYLKPFIEHPTRKFVLSYYTPGPGWRWHKNGPYIGEDPELGPKEVCIAFNLIELLDSSSSFGDSGLSQEIVKAA